MCFLSPRQGSGITHTTRHKSGENFHVFDYFKIAKSHTTCISFVRHILQIKYPLDICSSPMQASVLWNVFVHFSQAIWKKKFKSSLVTVTYQINISINMHFHLQYIPGYPDLQWIHMKDKSLFDILGKKFNPQDLTLANKR